MKLASVAGRRNDFKKVLAWLEVGEKLEITRRDKPYAVLTKVVENASPLIGGKKRGPRVRA